MANNNAVLAWRIYLSNFTEWETKFSTELDYEII